MLVNKRKRPLGGYANPGKWRWAVVLKRVATWMLGSLAVDTGAIDISGDTEAAAPWPV